MRWIDHAKRSFLEKRILNRDEGKEIDFETLRKSNEYFEFLAYHLSKHDNVISFDVSKYNAYQILEELELEKE